MILFVTSNEHKFAEVNQFMEKSGYALKWEKMKYIEIQGDTTHEISLDSALRLKSTIKSDFFLEDTGLYIDSLNGFPGPYSSFVASKIGNEGILKLLAGKERSARFLTVVTFCRDGACRQFEGFLNGSISQKISGEKGFGFDPVFIPEGRKTTLAEMSIIEKNEISHRGRALLKLVEHLRTES